MTSSVLKFFPPIAPIRKNTGKRCRQSSCSPGTIVDGLMRIEPLLTPVYDAIRTRQAASAYSHADETRWHVFIEKSGKTGHLWWLWLFAGDDTVVYVLDPTRSHERGKAPATKA